MNKPVTQASRGRFAVANLPSLFAGDAVRHERWRAARRRGQDEGDAAYYQRRAGEERAIAMASRHPHARLLHLELAERYALRAAAIREADEQLGPWQGMTLSNRS